MIIIEGPDKVGKSTLVKALRRALPGWEHRHHGVPPVSPFQYFGWFAAGARPRVIVDRLHWSELAYGATYREGSELSTHQWRLLELMLMANRAHVVLLDDATESVAARWGKGADDPFAPERIGLLQGHFTDLYEGTGRVKSHLPRQTHWLPDLVDPDTLATTEAFDNIVRAERERCNVYRSALLAPSLAMGCGTDFLLLGEAGSDRDQRYTLDPPVPFRDGPAAEYLWRALDEIGLRWWRGTYTNAANFATYKDFHEWLDAAMPWFTTTVCLGRKAEALVKGVRSSRCGDVIHVGHPMYVRRFFYGTGYAPWRDTLRAALQHVCDPPGAGDAGAQAATEVAKEGA